MEKWFLGGVVVALLILLFDKPLAADIIAQVPGQALVPPPANVAIPMPTNPNQAPPNILPARRTGCVSCAGPTPTVAAPGSPFSQVVGPSQSLPQLGNRLNTQPPGSPAPQPVLINPSFALF